MGDPYLSLHSSFHLSPHSSLTHSRGSPQQRDQRAHTHTHFGGDQSPFSASFPREKSEIRRESRNQNKTCCATHAHTRRLSLALTCTLLLNCVRQGQGKRERVCVCVWSALEMHMSLAAAGLTNPHAYRTSTASAASPATGSIWGLITLYHDAVAMVQTSLLPIYPPKRHGLSGWNIERDADHQQTIIIKHRRRHRRRQQ